MKGQKNTYGLRRRYAGRMAERRKIYGEWITVARSNNGNSFQASVIYERNQTRAYTTKELPGKFKVSLPNGWIRGWA